MKLIRFVLPFLILLFTARAAEGGMLRVVGIEDGRTIIVAAATPTRIQLAGIEIIDDASARLFLEYALESAWVSGEKRPDGYVVWRSPDGLFVNRELVLRGYARAISPELAPQRNFTVTYLGQLSSGRSPSANRNVSAPAGSGSDMNRSPRARRSRRPRQPPKTRAVRTE